MDSVVLGAWMDSFTVYIYPFLDKYKKGWYLRAVTNRWLPIFLRKKLNWRTSALALIKSSSHSSVSSGMRKEQTPGQPGSSKDLGWHHGSPKRDLQILPEMRKQWVFRSLSYVNTGDGTAQTCEDTVSNISNFYWIRKLSAATLARIRALTSRSKFTYTHIAGSISWSVLECLPKKFWYHLLAW